MPNKVETRLLHSPWHEGELFLQRHVGVVERMDAPGRNFVRTFMPDQHQQFFAMLPFIVLGTVDAEGDVWATLRAGRPGFMQAADAWNLDVHLPRDRLDPADAGMEDGDAIGMLGIQLETRRRNRLNGSTRRHNDDGFTIRVGHSFGNCPQYIHLRDFSFTRDPNQPGPVPPIRLEGFDTRAREMIAAADSFFVASYIDRENGERQVDVSHRGGRPGFVHVDENGILTIPDFSGNLFFNTLGNFMLNPRAGLVFVDFETGDMLQLTGDAEVILNSLEIAAFQGAERLWRFAPRKVVYRESGSPLRWALRADGWSPNALMTGTWKEARERLGAAAPAEQWRPFRVARIEPESATVKSLYLEPVDGAGLIPHHAGQHLPVRVAIERRAGKPLVRSYTLSSAPLDPLYRISVKREGAVSSHLHRLQPGDILETRAPAGAFKIDAAERRPAVLAAAGVGITPMIAMLRHIVYEGQRKRQTRPTWLFEGARSISERPFDREITSLVGQGDVRLVRALTQPDGAVADRDYDVVGRIDVALLKARLPFDDYDFYLCGPAPFMQSLYNGLRALNVADTRIHAETFGLSSLNRTPDAGTISTQAANQPVDIVFAASGKTARWQPGGGSLLDLAEAQGLSPEFGCRNGSCGTCSTRILEGNVAYPSEPSFPVRVGEALLCCAVPAEDERHWLHLSI